MERINQKTTTTPNDNKKRNWNIQAAEHYFVNIAFANDWNTWLRFPVHPCLELGASLSLALFSICRHETHMNFTKNYFSLLKMKQQLSEYGIYGILSPQITITAGLEIYDSNSWFFHGEWCVCFFPLTFFPFLVHIISDIKVFFNFLIEYGSHLCKPWHVLICGMYYVAW